MSVRIVYNQLTPLPPPQNPPNYVSILIPTPPSFNFTPETKSLHKHPTPNPNHNLPPSSNFYIEILNTSATARDNPTPTAIPAAAVPAFFAPLTIPDDALDGCVNPQTILMLFIPVDQYSS